MDLKDLNNYQLVLLTLLVSFVTSIATGIVTVYLLQTASPQVTGVINHVIERTIETVAPSAMNDSKTQTIIISEDDLVSQALAQGFQETGTLYHVVADAPQTTDTTATDTTAPAVDTTANDAVVSTGVLVDTAGTFVIPGDYTFAAGDYVRFSGGLYSVTHAYADKATGLNVLTLSPQTGAKSFADLASEGIGALPKIGQTALVVGSDNAFIRTIVTKISAPAKDQTNSTIMVSADIPATAKYAGAPVLSGEGKVIGIVMMDADGSSVIVGSDGITSAIKSSQTTPAPAK